MDPPRFYTWPGNSDHKMASLVYNKKVSAKRMNRQCNCTVVGKGTQYLAKVCYFILKAQN